MLSTFSRSLIPRISTVQSVIRANREYSHLRVLKPRHRSSTRSLIRSLSSAAASTRLPLSVNTLPMASQDRLPVVSAGERKVQVFWSPKASLFFHNIWLRDHCRCPECFHPITKQRLVNTFEISPDIRAIAVGAAPDGLEVTWGTADRHKSFYPWSWLQKNSYDPPINHADTTTPKVEWNSTIQESPPSVTYDEVMATDEKGLFKWLNNVDRFGFSFVTGVPPTPKATEELAERIGFIRKTQYGRLWDFTSDLAKGDTAYTNLELPAHTDNTYYTDPSGLQLFHLLSHTDGGGGATLLVDGFYVAKKLKGLHPEAYEILSQVPIPAHAAGEPTAIYIPSPPLGYPVLRHDPCTSKLIQVRWNNNDRSVMNHLQPEQVEKWYDAIRLWNEYLTSPLTEYWFQLHPGTAVVMDNHRVLHGRSPFTGKRRMCGAYIGIDEYRSKLAVLREKFAPDHVSKSTNHIPGVNVNGRNIWSGAL